MAIWWIPLALMAAAQTQTAPGPLRVSVQTDKAAYRTGEPIEMTLEVANTSRAPVSLHFNTSQRFDLLLHDPSGREAWAWAQERMFLQVLGQETIEPGGRRVYSERFLGTLAPGTYRVTGRLAAREATPFAFASIEIR